MTTAERINNAIVYGMDLYDAILTVVQDGRLAGCTDRYRYTDVSTDETSERIATLLLDVITHQCGMDTP